jgi:hypothetical protein
MTPISRTALLVLGVLAVGDCLTIEARRTTPATISLPPGGDLQRAIDDALPGDTVELAAGATYVGNFVLPARDGEAFITIKTEGGERPGDGQRVTPGDADHLAKLRSPNSSPTIATARGAHHWRLLLLEILGTPDGLGDIVALGDGSNRQTTLSQVPHDLIVDRCFIHGDAVKGQKRCVALNSAATLIANSYISDCKRIGQDAQAIEAWNGPGPFTIRNNYLEGAAENILIGGADPAIPGLVPSDIQITGNHIAKPKEWREQQWQIKTLVELKSGRNVTIDHNIIEYNWLAAQVGYAVLFTVRNQDGGCAWCQVEAIMFDHNVVRHSGGGVSILGVDNVHPSKQTRDVTIRDNLFADIDNERWGGNGIGFQVLGGPREITIDHNTIVQEHGAALIQVEGVPILSFAFTNNVARHNAYGMIGSDHAPGNDSLSTYFPASQILNNVLAGADSGRYPRGNQFPSTAEFQAQFVNYQKGDYRLIPGSAWRGAGTDGRDLGADASVLTPPDSWP